MQDLPGDIPRQREKALVLAHHLHADGDFYRNNAAILGPVVVDEYIVGAGGRVAPHGLQCGLVKVHHNVPHPHLQKLLLGIAKAVAGLRVDIQKAAFTVLQIESIGEMLQKMTVQGVGHRRPLGHSLLRCEFLGICVNVTFVVRYWFDS